MAVLVVPFIISCALAQVPTTGAGKATTGGTPFDPLTLITGNGAFYRADMGVSVSGSNVTSWADQSSFARNLANVQGSPSPTFSSTGFNTSFPGVSYTNGDNVGLATNPFNRTTTTLTMFMLVQMPNNPNGTGARVMVHFDGSTETSSTATALLLYSTGAPGAPPDGFWVLHNGVEVGNGGSPTSSNAGIYLIGFEFDGAHINIWLNGVVVGSGTANSDTLGSTIAAICIGNVTAPGLTRPTPAMNIAFAGETEKAMNTTDWTNLKNWSNANWGTSF